MYANPESKMGRLRGKVAIVTGGSSGIGRAVCLALAKEGVTVVVVGRNKQRVQATVDEVKSAHRVSSFSQMALGLQLDVRHEADMTEMAERTLTRFGCIDILVASAGILRAVQLRPTMLVETSVEAWDQILDTNLKGVFLSNRAVMKAMMAQHAGHIINVSSLSGRQALPFDSPYCASKFGVIGLSEALAEELKSYGVRVQVVLPGNTDTPIWSQNKIVPRAARTLPVARVADLILYLITWPQDADLGPIVIAPHQSPPKPEWRK
jgi:NAD(P)-dependent dehydrogenase (short-subunit alcohol dehydrogenase family)